MYVELVTRVGVKNPSWLDSQNITLGKGDIGVRGPLESSSSMEQADPPFDSESQGGNSSQQSPRDKGIEWGRVGVSLSRLHWILDDVRTPITLHRY